MQAFFNYCLEHFIECATFRLIYWKAIVGILRYIEKKIEKKNCHNAIVHLQLCAWLPSLQTWVRIRVTLLWYKVNLAAFKCKLITLLSYQLPVDTGLYHNMVTFSLTPIKGFAMKYTIVKWPFRLNYTCWNVHQCLC